MAPLGAAAILSAWRDACRYDVLACKPGNVSLESPGHDMEARDFLLSAAVSAAPLIAPGAGLGDRVLGAVQATRRAVGCNTNLGILLLAAPLVVAAERPAGGLRAGVGEVLAAASVEDTRRVFEAIVRAAPGGLGTSADHDVHGAATRPLQAVMAHAAGRDRIALQYANGFADVFDFCVPRLRAERDRRDSLEAATSACFLALLAAFPDSHVARKHGAALAAAVRARAQEVTALYEACENPARRQSILQEFDRELKRGGVNPGTSADLTVAGVLAMQLETARAAISRGNAGAV